ncbi:hypothetical protein Tco_0897655 [Tanacetum coccineum]
MWCYETSCRDHSLWELQRRGCGYFLWMMLLMDGKPPQSNSPGTSSTTSHSSGKLLHDQVILQRSATESRNDRR